MKNSLKNQLDTTETKLLDFSGISFDLQLFAGEKTEPATEKKRREATQQGNVAKSQDLASVVILLTGFLMLRFYGPQLYGLCGEYMRYCMSTSIHTDLALPETIMLFNQLVYILMKMLAPFMVAIALSAVAANMIQTGFLFRFDPIIPNLDRLNPISGLQNIFSWKLVAELVKSILKILIVAYIPYSTLREQIPMIIRFVQLEPMPAIIILLKTIFYMAIKIILILLALAIADWFFQKWRHEENLKMSKEEIKEEYKQREGDPRIKQKIREKQRQASTRRMMDEVPKATVVVTNPTHIACALRYDPEQNNAPIVVAMGAGLIARKIKEIANENNVPIVENKPLARALYKMVEIGDEIPSDLYGAVVEILAQVYRTRSKQA
ncbi:MAG: flagellar biosynthesis protein FlhB [Clostridiales bacterium]|jgi:flagellar biosynthetic protein FlhB|nr:flagellar biosynthesis protein FlhB [Clostridiales bacterium]MDN5281358.1 flagellar biosynthesis protein FlhB [Candidatus Ozemobacter sp.]